MAGAPFGGTPFGTWPVDLSTLQRTTDTVFLTGMSDVAAIEWDTTYLGETVGIRGAPNANRPDRWQIVEGFEAISCRITLGKIMLTDGAGRPGQTADGRVQFPQAVPADRRNRLVYQDPVFGERHFYLMGKVEPKMMERTPHHWWVYITETPTT